MRVEKALKTHRATLRRPASSNAVQRMGAQGREKEFEGAKKACCYQKITTTTKS